MDLGNFKLNRAAQKGIHSYTHSIVKDVCDYFGVKEFGIWLGVAKRIGAGELKAKLDYIKSRGIKSPKYLMSCVKKK